MTGPSRDRQAGVTLLEMLVALSVFAALGVAGMALLDTTLRVQSATDDRLDRLSDVDTALTILRRDLAQAEAAGLRLKDGALRVVRDADGAVMVLDFALQDGTLVRNAAFDGAPPVDQPLIGDVASVRWRVLDGARAWRAAWPPEDGAAAAPRAVELALEIALPGRVDRVAITRLLPMPAGAAP